VYYHRSLFPCVHDEVLGAFSKRVAGIAVSSCGSRSRDHVFSPQEKPIILQYKALTSIQSKQSNLSMHFTKYPSVVAKRPQPKHGPCGQVWLRAVTHVSGRQYLDATSNCITPPTYLLPPSRHTITPRNKVAIHPSLHATKQRHHHYTHRFPITRNDLPVATTALHHRSVHRSVHNPQSCSSSSHAGPMVRPFHPPPRHATTNALTSLQLGPLRRRTHHRAMPKLRQLFRTRTLHLPIRIFTL
jgi:hypothetical protein